MFDYSNLGFSKKEQIEVILKEYDTLRAEIVSRTASGFGLVAIGNASFGALVIYASTKRSLDTTFWIALVVTLIGAIWCTCAGLLPTRRLGRRVAQLEKQINELAEVPLLGWESRSAPKGLGKLV